MRVLYTSHTSQVSGAERSLLDLLAVLPEEVTPVLACPRGPLADAALRLGVRVETIPETDGSLRIHPYYTTRAMSQVGLAAMRLRLLSKRVGAEIIHANSIRAGLVATMAGSIGGPPVIVHLRDCLPRGAFTDVVRRLLHHRSAMMIANSRYTAAAFGRPRHCRMITIHNPIDLDRFRPNIMTRARARERLGLDPSAPAIAVIGQLAPWKAQDDAIYCLQHVRERWPSAKLLLVGRAVFTSRATRYDNTRYAESIRRLAADRGLEPHVLFLGEREDIPEILRALDLLLSPSLEEPFGRVILEAMAMQVPVVATNVGGPAEFVTHNRDGVLLPPRRPALWADTVNSIVSDPVRAREMGRQGRATAMRFGRVAHVIRVVSAYREVLHAN